MKTHNPKDRIEKKLNREGWVKQFTTDEPRLSEAVELYKSLSYEAHLEKAVFKDDETCKTCFSS